MFYLASMKKSLISLNDAHINRPLLFVIILLALQYFVVELSL